MPSGRNIHTRSAPEAIGPYSQAIVANGVVYASGQIHLDPATMELVGDDPGAQIHQVFRNLAAVTEAAGGSLADVVRLSVYRTDLGNFAMVNEIMAEYFSEPYPARAAIGIAALPRAALVEMDAIAHIP